MAVEVGGILVILAFYLVILGIGLWASRKTGFRVSKIKLDDVLLANRSLGLLFGVLTMTATWVGGGYINGTAEIVATDGLVWCQGPIYVSLSLVIGGICFADKMRSSEFSTLLDPFHWKYGDLMCCLLYIAALTGDVFYSGSILTALGASLEVILDVGQDLAIIISAAIALSYTIIGGLYSVAYTDIIQLACMFFGLWLCVPFAMTHDASVSISRNASENWFGTLPQERSGSYIDIALLMLFGGVPWQTFWQRALSAKNASVSVWLCCLGGIGSIVMTVPAVLLGAVAASTDWNVTGYGQPAIAGDDSSQTLPLVLYHLCPKAVTYIGLGAISAAVMSSIDSSILSASSMFSRNVVRVIYARATRKKLSSSAQIWTMRCFQVVVTVLACVLAIVVDSTYGLFVLCGDVVYVILFPQLVCVMYVKDSNSYGSFFAFVVGLVLRLLAGEPSLHIKTVIEYPWYIKEDDTQLFPFRTFAMIVSLLSLLMISYLTKFLFERRILPISWDIYGCFPHMNIKKLTTYDGPTVEDRHTASGTKVDTTGTSLDNGTNREDNTRL